MNIRMIAMALLAVAAGQAVAGTLHGSANVQVWNQNVRANTWNIRGDHLPPGGTGGNTEPESMAFRDGKLYVTGDSGDFGSRIVSYTPGIAGSLTVATQIAYSRTYGPEGLAANTSGVGFGANSTLIGFATEAAAGNTGSYETIDISGGTATLGTAIGLADPEDATFIESEGRFAVVQETAGENVLRVYNHTAAGLTTVVREFETPDVKGVAVLPAWMTNLLVGQNRDAFLMVTDELDANMLVITDLNGNRLANDINMNTLGLNRINDRDMDLEAIAVDTATGWIYIGDDTGRQAYAFQAVPEPGTLAALAFGGALLARRRRSAK